MTAPTPQDHANVAARKAIADSQLGTYQEAMRLSRAALGRGWRPWMRLSLVPRDYHTGNSESVAVAFKVYCGDRKTNEFSRYVRRMPDGSVKADTSYEPLFGDLLTEPDAKTITIGGQEVHPSRYCLTWSAVELYKPRSPESLAKARRTREAKAVAEEAKGNLFSQQVLAEGPVKPRRTR